MPISTVEYIRVVRVSDFICTISVYQKRGAYFDWFTGLSEWGALVTPATPCGLFALRRRTLSTTSCVT